MGYLEEQGWLTVQEATALCKKSTEAAMRRFAERKNFKKLKDGNKNYYNKAELLQYYDSKIICAELTANRNAVITDKKQLTFLEEETKHLHKFADKLL